MLKRFKVLFLSLSIIILGASVTYASSFNYNDFNNYEVNSEFYDTYTKKIYNYSWDVSIWSKQRAKNDETTETSPVKPTPTKPEIVKPEVVKPEVPNIPDQSKPVKPKPEESTNQTVGDASLSQMENEVVRLVNIERQKNGLKSFTPSGELSNISRLKSQDMATNNYFSHQSPQYGSAFEMMKSFGISYKTAGENIAKGYNSAQSVVKGWMNSQGHRENILNPSFNTIGVGSFTSSKGTIYWTQMFTN